ARARGFSRERLQPLGGLADPRLARDDDPPRPRRRRGGPPRRRPTRREAGPPPDRARGSAAAGVLTRRSGSRWEIAAVGAEGGAVALSCRSVTFPDTDGGGSDV